MEADKLTGMVCEAIVIALQRHKDRNAILTDEDRGDIKAKIESVYALHKQAADKNLALLEIACDAAAQFARDYNYQNRNSPRMEPKWMYILVQALLAPEMKPELVAGDVSCLSELLEPKVEDTMTADDSAVDESRSAATNNDSAREEGTTPQWGPDKPLQTNRSFWLSHEIMQLIWLQKYKAYHQNEVATKLGRSLHSVTNKWAKVAKHEEWEDYMNKCLSSRILGKDLSRPSTPE